MYAYKEIGRSSRPARVFEQPLECSQREKKGEIMIRRVLSFSGMLAIVALAAISFSMAENVKTIILNEVDPGGVNGTIAKYHDEMTSAELDEYQTNYDDGLGYYISPVATVTRIDNGDTVTETHKMLIVSINAGSTVIATRVTCTHSGCTGGCYVGGCHPTTEPGSSLPACSGATCTGGSCGSSPNCSKSESTSSLSLIVFGSI